MFMPHTTLSAVHDNLPLHDDLAIHADLAVIVTPLFGIHANLAAFMPILSPTMTLSHP